jgi:5-formyltetrahydrofolate cyclo-ligase
VVAGIGEAKQTLRTQVWDLLERERAAERGVHGRIPAFTGADAAAARLAGLAAWRAAQVIKAVPDRAQQPVRERALRDAKLVYMAVPMLADDRPFYVLDPGSLTMARSEAASREGAARVAPKIAVDQMRPVDMVVCGSVAVNRNGARLGKGAGYSDIEVALLQEAGLIAPRTVIVTTVHHPLVDPSGRCRSLLAGDPVAWCVSQGIGGLTRIGARRHRMVGRSAVSEGERGRDGEGLPFGLVLA